MEGGGEVTEERGREGIGGREGVGQGWEGARGWGVCNVSRMNGLAGMAVGGLALCPPSPG